MPVSRARGGRDANHPLGGDRERAGGSLELRLLVRIAPPLPGDQRPAWAQQGHRELRQRREPADRPSGDHIVGLTPARGRRLLRPSLGPGAEGSSVPEPRGRDRALDELALATDRLDQVNAGARQGSCESEPRKPGTGAEIGEPGRCADQAQAAERVIDVDTPSPVGVADGAH